ncbi:MAG: helix-turn-helix domain-containing protein [Lachnospiraceae bacterium]|nr:helix-turn-helix domain-containing protein [Lachnospiraceae bacterium]
MDLVKIGNRIRLARRENKLTQEKLAELADVTPHYIYEIEHGLKAMSLDTLEKISLALDLSLDYLFWGDGMSDKGNGTSTRDDQLNTDINRLSRSEKQALVKILSGIIIRLKDDSK